MTPAENKNNDGPELSIVVPVYNEEENLQQLTEKILSALRPLNKTFEIVYVDDGSKDRSWEIIAQLRGKHPEIHPVKFKKNAGQTAAFAAGFKHARGKLFVTLDADLQNDPADIPILLNALGDYDAVCGWRFDRHDSLWKKFCSKIGNSFRTMITGKNIHDTGCSLKLFRREAAQSLVLFKGLHRFFASLLEMNGFRVTEAKVSHHHRTAGKSKYGAWNRMWKGLADCFAIRWMKKNHLNYEVENKDELFH